MMGNNPVSFVENLIIVHDDSGKTVSEYYMTLALMEMFFTKKLPAGAHPTEEVINNYKDLLLTTRSAYKDNDIKQGPKDFRSSKYVGLISGLVKKKGGRLKRSPVFVRYVEPEPKRIRYYGGGDIIVGQEDIDADAIEENKTFWRWGSRPGRSEYMRLLINK